MAGGRRKCFIQFLLYRFPAAASFVAPKKEMTVGKQQPSRLDEGSIDCLSAISVAVAPCRCGKVDVSLITQSFDHAFIFDTAGITDKEGIV